MQAQQKNKEATFHFPHCTNSISQNIVDTIGKLEPIEKTKLYVISQGWLTS